MPTISTTNHALQFGTTPPTVSIYGTDTDGYIIYDMSAAPMFYQFAPNTKYFAIQIIFSSPFGATPSVVLSPANSTTAALHTSTPSIEFFVDQTTDVNAAFFKISGVSSGTPTLGPSTLAWYYQVSTGTAGGGGGGGGGSINIGDTVGSSVDKSVLFISGSVLSQNSSTFVWDYLNTRLGLGTSTPATTLDVAGDASVSGLFHLGSSSISIPSAPSNNQVLKYNGTSFVPATSPNIGDTITGGTSKSVLFVNASGAVAQDNTNFNWDGVNHRLGIGAIAASPYTLDVAGTTRINNSVSASDAIIMQNSNTAGFSSITALDSSANIKGAFGYANSGTSDNARKTKVFIWTNTSTDLVITNQANTTTPTAVFSSAGVFTLNTRDIKPNFSNPNQGQSLAWDTSANAYIPTTAVGAVSSVSNSDSTLTVSPTSGAVVASLNLGHANTWSAKQTFSGHIAVDGFTIDLSGGVSTGQAIVFNGTNFVAQQTSSILATIADSLIGTSSSTVLSYSPPVDANYMVMVYYRVASSTTVITISITWEDNNGSQISHVIPSGTSEGAGSYTTIPTFINAMSSSPIVITAQAGTTNQLFISASILQA